MGKGRGDNPLAFTLFFVAVCVIAIHFSSVGVASFTIAVVVATAVLVTLPQHTCHDADATHGAMAGATRTSNASKKVVSKGPEKRGIQGVGRLRDNKSAQSMPARDG